METPTWRACWPVARNWPSASALPRRLPASAARRAARSLRMARSDSANSRFTSASRAFGGGIARAFSARASTSGSARLIDAAIASGLPRLLGGGIRFSLALYS